MKLPQNLEAEATCLGAILLRGLPALAEVSAVAGPDDFYHPAHAEVLRVIHALALRCEPIDTVTIWDELERRGMSKVADAQFLSKLSDRHGTARSAGHHARLVRAAAIRREVMLACEQISGEAAEGPEELERWLAAAERRLAEVADRGRSADRALVAAAQGLAELAEDLQRPPAPVLPTGLADLDAQLEMEAGHLIVVGARPGVGKTALIGGVAEAVALGRGRRAPAVPALVFSLELSRRQWLLRAIAREAAMDVRALQSSSLPPAAERARAEAWGRLGRAPLWIDDDARELDQIASRVLRFRHAFGQPEVPILVVVDYLQRVRTQSREARYIEIGDICRGLKDLARSAGAVVLAAAQINRKAGERALGEPRLDDLREGGDIEAEADAIVLLHRPERELRPDATQADRDRARGVALALVAKNRHGPEGARVGLRWLAAQTRFANAAK